MHEGERRGSPFQRCAFSPEVILMGIRWYLADPLSIRHAEELSADADDQERSDGRR
jgi:hypothetical protein